MSVSTIIFSRGFLIILCSLLCLLCPVGISVLAMIYGPESDPGMEPPWSLDAIDYLWLTAFGCTALVIVLVRKWRWLAALMTIPLLIATSVLAFFGGMWVSGNYL